MNIQTVREDLAAVLAAITPDGWRVSTVTVPEIYTGLIQVGHATENVPQTFKTYAVTLRITLWVNESNAKIGVTQFYELLSPGPLSIRAALQRGADVPGTDRRLKAAGPMVTEEAGPRDEGPSGFLAVDILIPFQVTAA